MKNSLTGRQVALFASLMLFSSKLLLLPSLLYSANAFGGVLCLFILLVAELFFLFVLIQIKLKYKNISLFEFISQKIGKILTKFIFILLFIFFFLKFIYILQESFSYLKQTLYSDATIIVYLICVLPVISSCVHKGLKAFGRTLEIFFILIFFAIIVCSFIWITSVANFSFSVLNNNGFSGLISGIFDYAFWFGDYFFIMLLIDKINLKKKETKVIYFYAIFSSLILLAFYFAYFFIYQSSSFLHINAITDIIQFATNLGSVGKLDIIAIGVIMFLVFFQGGLLLFCAEECLSKIFTFGHRLQPLIFLNIITLISLYLIFNNSNNLIIFFSEHLKFLSIFLVFVLPIILLLFLINYNKNKNLISKNNNFKSNNKYSQIKLINNKLIKNNKKTLKINKNNYFLIKNKIIIKNKLNNIKLYFNYETLKNLKLSFKNKNFKIKKSTTKNAKNKNKLNFISLKKGVKI